MRDQSIAAAGFVKGLKSSIKMGVWRLSPALLERMQRKPEQEFSIAVYTGDSIDTLAPVRGIGQPVLTKDDVTDIPASFVADPFLHRAQDQWYMFFEVMHSAYRRGVISVASSNDALHWQYDRVVLTEPFHLSYPYVFEHDGAHYMIPESGRAGAVTLYRAETFPYRWIPVQTLLDDAAYVDSSICAVDGLWWMWTAAAASGGKRALRLFFADQPFGPWREHPSSPIAQEESGLVRPGGRILVDAGRVTRFAQSAYPDYGSKLYAFEVAELSPTRYAERPAAGELLGPGDFEWNRDGMHHIDVQRQPDGRLLALVDGWRKNPR